MKLDIEDLRKEMTREEFEKCLLEGRVDNEVFLKFKNQGLLCPCDITGLKEQEEMCEELPLGSGKCKKCWLKAIENIEFKDEENSMRKESAYGDCQRIFAFAGYPDLPNTIPKKYLLQSEQEEQNEQKNMKEFTDRIIENIRK